MKLLDIFTINEVDSVGVDNTGVVRLRLDFEIIRNQTDWTAGILLIPRLVW